MAAAIQQSWLKRHWPYVLGATLLHALLAGLFGLTMITMQRNAPTPTLAIEAIVVDQNQLAKPSRKAREDRAKQQQAERDAAERKRQEEQTQREQERAEQERQESVKRQEQEREQERVRQEQVARERVAQEKAAQEKLAQEKALEEKRAIERKQEAERQQKIEAERKRVAEIERKQREREEAERRRNEADAKASEEQLRRQLEEEEGLMQARASGAMNQYAAMIQQHVERQWNRPPSAHAGLQCEVSVAQSPNGTVLRVQVGTCNGDAAVKQSIENAVQRASPLPLPSDMRLFERNLRFIFKPAD